MKGIFHKSAIVASISSTLLAMSASADSVRDENAPLYSPRNLKILVGATNTWLYGHNHIFATNRYEASGEYYHVAILKCTKCGYEKNGLTEEHDSFQVPDKYWMYHTWSLTTNDLVTGCNWSMHMSENICGKCGERHSNWGQTVCAPTVSHGEDGIDTLTCTLCGTSWECYCHTRNVYDDIGPIMEITEPGIMETYPECFPNREDGITDIGDGTHAVVHSIFEMAGGRWVYSPSHNSNDHIWIPDGRHPQCIVCGAEEESSVAKITKGSIVRSDIDDALGQRVASRITAIDGDDPVYEIGAYTLENYFTNCLRLVEVKFNYVTNIGTRAFANAFSGCSNLQYVGLHNLPKVQSGVFSNAFANCNSITNLDFYSAKEIAENTIHWLSPAAELHLENLSTLPSDYSVPLCQCSVGHVYLDYTTKVLPVGPFYGNVDNAGNMRITIPECLLPHYIDNSWPSNRLNTVDTMEITGWVMTKDGAPSQVPAPVYYEDEYEGGRWEFSLPWSDMTPPGATEYTSGVMYEVGDYVMHSGMPYECVEEIEESTIWAYDEDKFEELSVIDQNYVFGSKYDLEVSIEWGVQGFVHTYKATKSVIRKVNQGE